MPTDILYSALERFYSVLPSWTDARLHGGFAFSSSFFSIAITAYNQTSSTVEFNMTPFLHMLDNPNITYSVQFVDQPRYYDLWMSKDSGAVGTHWGSSGRLIPRATLQNPDSLADLMRVIQFQVEDGAIVGGTVLNGTSRTGIPNAVNPAWRQATVLALTITDWDFSGTSEAWNRMLENQEKATEVWDPMWDAVTPGSGNYANEADVAKPNWKKAFYGSHYDRLLEIKRRWDPKSVFY